MAGDPVDFYTPDWIADATYYDGVMLDTRADGVLGRAGARRAFAVRTRRDGEAQTPGGGRLR